MRGCWADPTAKHAYLLSIFSVIVTLACFLVGVGLYMVREKKQRLAYLLLASTDIKIYPSLT